MRTLIRAAGTVVALYFWLTTVYNGMFRPTAYTGWWILSATVGAAVLVLALWWPTRKDRDSERP